MCSLSPVGHPPPSLPVLFCYEPEKGRQLAALLLGQRPLFVCVIASTDTALIPGISAAGASPELIPFTAAADAEVLTYGAARCIVGVPSNPQGPPGPALITLAALQLADIPCIVVNAGCRVQPEAPCVDLGSQPGGCITEGKAVLDAFGLFASGLQLGQALAQRAPYLVVGESVPGGTTTALALLLALGIAAEGKVSSSMAGNAHPLKRAVARRALAHLDRDRAAAQPLEAVVTLGDPMQAAAGGIVAGAASAGCPVLLAGGTQMIAVLALLQRLAALEQAPPSDGRLAVATTRWVIEDSTADPIGLMRGVGRSPLLATPLSFASSRHPPLRRYEEGLVKEGVGAGGAAVAATLAASVSTQQMMERVEQIYEGLLTRGDHGQRP